PWRNRPSPSSPFAQAREIGSLRGSSNETSLASRSLATPSRPGRDRDRAPASRIAARRATDQDGEASSGRGERRPDRTSRSNDEAGPPSSTSGGVRRSATRAGSSPGPRISQSTRTEPVATGTGDAATQPANSDSRRRQSSSGQVVA